MPSILYIVKLEHLSTGQPGAANVAFDGPSQPAVSPVNSLFRHSGACIKPETERRNPGCMQNHCTCRMGSKKYM
jgi:hypothetical protein